MPPRLVTVAILLFWLATTSRLAYLEVLPRFQTGEPPPFTIDLTAEVSAQQVRWTVLQEGKPVGRGTSRVERNDEGSYDFTAKFSFNRFELGPLKLVKLEIRGAYGVNDEGKLLAG